jgi:hypothetical protein
VSDRPASKEVVAVGQYHYVVNLDKREFLHPHRFGDGLKLMEFGCSTEGTLTGLAILLACSNGRGGGDLYVWVPDDKDFRGETPTFVEGTERKKFGGQAVTREAEAERLYSEFVGRWAGDRIAIIGDYAEDGDLAPEHRAGSIYGRTDDCDGRPTFDSDGSMEYAARCGSKEIHDPHPAEFTDISEDVIRTMALDYYLRGSLKERAGAGFAGSPKAELLV